MIALAILAFCTVKLATAAEQCSTYQFSYPFYPGDSCKKIYDWNPQTHNRSGYYWFINPPCKAYCDMEQRVVCGNIGGWTRIANVNITRGDECPTGWSKNSQAGVSFCRSPSDNAGCYPVLFSSRGISYQKVCGMARGYQKSTTDGLPNDALFITHGNPRHHIWTYEIPVHDNDCHGCNVVTDAFTSLNFYCEGNNSGQGGPGGYYLVNPLWDGLDCPTGNFCCDNPVLPWFYRELDGATMDNVEVRICTDSDFDNEGILVDQLELYIQ